MNFRAIPVSVGKLGKAKSTFPFPDFDQDSNVTTEDSGSGQHHSGDFVDLDDGDHYGPNHVRVRASITSHHHHHSREATASEVLGRLSMTQRRGSRYKPKL